MIRLLFEKKGEAVWISHLDLMRLFQRAFKRAGLPLTHTQGYNPRPSVSIALPLSVGVASKCELLDFTLEGAPVSPEEIKERLNAVLVAGIRVQDVYEGGEKLKNLTLLDCQVIMEYDRGIPEGALHSIRELFSRKSLTVEKKGKNGLAEQDIAPMIRRMDLHQTDENTLALTARICCQNPSLNPALLSAAVSRYLPEYAPDFSKCLRMEVYDNEERVFR